MLIILKSPTPEQVQNVLDKLTMDQLEFQLIDNQQQVIVLVRGSAMPDRRRYERLPAVSKVLPIETPFKLASREFKQQNTTVAVGKAVFGQEAIPVIAGPCAIEGYEQMKQVAHYCKTAGATLLRGGAYKPRTSPYSFQGLEEEGLAILRSVSREVSLPVVSELMDVRKLDVFCESVDIIQIGARNMQNFVLLKEVSKVQKPVLLKRGAAATIEEWLMAAEYILAGGNSQVILCERGVRSFDSYIRNTLDLSAVALIKLISHLPVVVDPSHGTGDWRLVAPMAGAAVAVGADGLIIEVHPKPEEALSDGMQSLTFDNFTQLMHRCGQIAATVGRSL